MTQQYPEAQQQLHNNLKIGNTPIGSNHDVYFIGELSVNHKQSLDIALKTMREIKNAGAQAIKLQTYKAESLTLDVDNNDFHIAQNSVWDGKTYYQLFKENAMPWEWHQTLFNAAKDLKLHIFSTPFDKQGVELLQSLNAIAYKIASYEIRHLTLIKQVAETGKPILISTGIANSEDIQRAINICHKAGNYQIILMKCTSAYPATPETLQLNHISQLQQQFHTPVGLSDHSYSTDKQQLVVAPMVATALGAVVIEKHVILDRSMQTADSQFSLDPNELKTTIDAIRNVRKTMAEPKTQNYKENDDYPWNGKEAAQTGGRSVYISQDIPKGGTISTHNTAIVRPGLSLHPKYYHSILGRQTNKPLKRGDRISLDNLV